MVTSLLVGALARAFVEGDPAPDAVVERATRILGREWRWLRPLARRYHKKFAIRPRLIDVLLFFERDEGFCRAIERHEKTLDLAQRLPDGNVMQPAAAAKNWPLPRIEDVPSLVRWLDVSTGELEWFTNHALSYKEQNPRLRHYRYRVLQKDSNHVRLIEAPKQRLKQIQQKILTGILDFVPLHDAVHGFRKGRSIQTFCAPHVSQLVVLKMDLHNFFPSISQARVQSLFRTFGYPEPVADMLGGLCCNAAPRNIWHDVAPDIQMLYRQPHLPQGAPTSPALANLSAYHLDCRLQGLAQAAGAHYTRYADDLALSGGLEFAKCVDRFSIQAAAIAAEEGFAVHHRKTRIMRRSVRQHIAGLVINERPNIRRSDFDKLKAILTNCIRCGPASQNRESHADFPAHLKGRIAFVRSIHPAKGAKLGQLFDRILWPVKN